MAYEKVESSNGIVPMLSHNSAPDDPLENCDSEVDDLPSPLGATHQALLVLCAELVRSTIHRLVAASGVGLTLSEIAVVRLWPFKCRWLVSES